LLSTSKISESFDAGNPVGGIEPLNISYCTIERFFKKIITLPYYKVFTV